MRPSWIQLGPTWPQHGVQVGPKIGPLLGFVLALGASWGPRGPKCLPRPLRTSIWGGFGAQLGLKLGQVGPQTLPKSRFLTPRPSQNQRFANSRHRARELQACPDWCVWVLSTFDDCAAFLNSPLPCTHEKHHLGPNIVQFGANLGSKPSQNRGSWAPKPPKIEVLRALGGLLGPQKLPKSRS